MYMYETLTLASRTAAVDLQPAICFIKAFTAERNIDLYDYSIFFAYAYANDAISS